VRIEAYTGYSKIKVVMATGMELIAAFAAALLLAFIGLAFSPVSFPAYFRWTAFAMIVPLLVSLYPPVLRSVMNRLLRLIKKESLDCFPPYSTNLALVALYTLPGFLQGLGLFSILRSLYDISFAHYLTITGSYYAASIAGLIAIFAPGGLGVREGILFLILPVLVPKEIAIVSAIVMRLVTITGEIALAVVWMILFRFKCRVTTCK
jgi:hypothetical protein